MRFSIRPVALLSVALLAAACDVKVGEQGISLDVAHGKASDEWKRTYTLPTGGQLEIVNINGVIEGFPATGTQVELTARREVRAGSDEEAQAQLAKAEMIEEISPTRVKVALKTDREAGAGPTLRSRSRLNIQYRVGVPKGLQISFRTENGAVRLENLDGRITAASTNGPVVGRGLSGSIDASTVNGGVEIEIESLTGDSRVVTVNGPATLSLAPGVGAELDASAVNGGVSVHQDMPLTATERTGRRVAGRINDGGPTIVVQTTNGGVRVGTPGSGRGFGRRGRGRAPAGG